MKATVIIDNIRSEELEGEWGLCIHIDYDGHSILLDTGSSSLFLENAKALGVDIGGVDAGILSHAHFDHANGLKAFFKNNDAAKFYLRDGAEENCYKNIFLFKKYIGMPKNIINEYGNRIDFVKGDYKLYEGVYLIPHKTAGLEKCGIREQMLCKVNGAWKNDDFSHEQSLVFETEKGLVTFNSCSHGGAATIIDEVSETFPDKKVYAMIGGFHLYNKTEEEVLELAKKLEATGVEYICTGHCTKDKAYSILKEELGEKVHKLHVGLVMEF